MNVQGPLRIAIVSQYYKPENAKIPNGLAQGLADRGHSVRVITGYPNYPAGKLYAEFRQKLIHYERDRQVAVRRVPIIISHSQNPLARFANYASFAFSSMMAGRFVRNADVVYVYATQMTAAVAPAFWRRSRGQPFVLHIQDLWPESVTGSSMIRGGAAKRGINALLRPWLTSIYGAASSIVTIAPSMRAMLVDRGVDAAKLHTVLNWDDAAPPALAHQPESHQSGGADSGVSVVYAGNLGELQDLETVVRAAAMVTDLEGFRVSFVGAGVAEESLRRLADELGSPVEFVGPVRPEGMAAVYADSDFQLVTLKDLPIFRGTIPSKLQGSLAHGKPVITTVAGDVADIVQQNGVGLVSAPESANALAATFRRAYEMTFTERVAMGARARRYYDDEMSMTQGIDRFEMILQDAAKQTL